MPPHANGIGNSGLRYCYGRLAAENAAVWAWMYQQDGRPSDVLDLREVVDTIRWRFEHVLDRAAAPAMMTT